MRTEEDILLERLNCEDNGSSYSIIDGKLHVTSFRNSTPIDNKLNVTSLPNNSSRTFFQEIADFFCNIF